MVVRFCDTCRAVRECPTCHRPVTGFKHVGVRGATSSSSGIWHYAVPCGHKYIGTQQVQVSKAALAVYKGGPLWRAGYRWQNVFWGTYWKQTNIPFTPARVDKSVVDIEADQSYSGGLSEYNVGRGSILASAIIGSNPPQVLDDSQVGGVVNQWIQTRLVPELNQTGAYNIFFPPGVTVTLSSDKSCTAYCDFHNTDGTHFYTVEPYPCQTGCNQCTSSEFDTLTQGLSEEMVELKTDMDPGTGWVIGNEELCVPPDTLLLGDNKPISDYNLGDKIVGVSGLEKVNGTFVRTFNGVMVKIRGSGMLPLSVTPNHPLLVVSTVKGKLTSPYWKKAREVQLKHSSQDGDYLLLPILEGSVDTREYSLDTTHRTNKPKVSKFVLDADTAWLLGLYVAEGFTEARHKLHWALSRDEASLASRILKVLEKLRAKGWVSYQKSEASMVVHVGSRTLKKFFVEHCGRGARNKQMPDFILYHKDSRILESFIQGYLEGDGGASSNKTLSGREYRNHAFNTSSKKLGLQLQLAGARLGKFVPLHKYHHDGLGAIQGREVIYREGTQGHFYDSHADARRRWKDIDGRYMALPVVEKRDTLYNGLVYNIATDDHTYLISNAVTHNCDYCDVQFKCRQISTGEYVNAWYSNSRGSCWVPSTRPRS